MSVRPAWATGGTRSWTDSLTGRQMGACGGIGLGNTDTDFYDGKFLPSEPFLLPGGLQLVDWLTSSRLDRIRTSLHNSCEPINLLSFFKF